MRRLIFIEVPLTTGYVRHFKSKIVKRKLSKVDKRISFKADDKELFKGHIKLLEKIIYLVKNLKVNRIMMMEIIQDILILK